MRRTLILIIASVCSMFIASITFAAPLLSVGDYFGNPGDIIQPAIEISDIFSEKIFSFSFTLSIVPEDEGLVIATPRNVTKGSAIGTGWTAGGIPLSSYSIDFIGVGNFFAPDYLDNGPTFTLNLSVIGNGSWDLVLSGVVFGDENGLPINLSTENGTVRSTVPMPSTIILLGGGLIGLVALRCCGVKGA